MPMLPKKALTLLSSLILIGLTSCGGKVSQCKQLATPINEAKDFIRDYEQDMDQALSQFSSIENLTDLNTAASEYIRAVENARTQLNALAQEINSANIEDEQLNEYRGQHTELITQWSVALTTARDAMQSLTEVATEDEVRSIFGRFQARTDSAYSAIQTIDREEAVLVESLNAYCESNAQAQ